MTDSLYTTAEPVLPALPASGDYSPGAWFYALRDRLLASTRFQRMAARFPLTRPIARRRARALFDISAGFVYSQILFACVQSRLLEQLANGPRSVDAIATAIDLPAEGALRLLRAAASLRLVQPAGNGQYRLGDLGAVMLGNPSIGAMVMHHEALYLDLARPRDLLAGDRENTHLGAYWPYAGSEDRSALPEAEVGAYSALMASSQAMLADDILHAASLQECRHLLEVAGGEGVFMSAALKRWPQLQGTLLDLPLVAERAAARFEAEGVAARATTASCDMFCDTWPQGADAVAFVRVLHDHDDEPAQALLHKARAALPPGGRLLIAEPMAQTRGAAPVGDGYFGFYLMAMGSGRPRSAQELRAMVERAGFVQCRELKTAQPMLVRVLTAEVPAAGAERHSEQV